jgi:sirohydrochlorin ferrochelatase
MTEPSKIENPNSRIALLVLVHGSPRASANEPMHRVVELIRERGVYPIVEVGFMECNEPTIPEAVESCVEQGATRVIAVPYFLHTGNHVADDLPTLLEEAKRRYPEVEFLMGDFIGRAPELTDILLKRALAARNS